MLVEWLKKAPATVVVTVILVCFLGVVAVLGGFVALELAGKPTDEYRAFINTIANLIVLPFVGIGGLASVVAARSASRAEDNTNGKLSALLDENRALRSVAGPAADDVKGPSADG